MEDNEIKEGIFRKSKQIIHPQSETDAALIFWRVKCLHVDMSGHKSHKSCLKNLSIIVQSENESRYGQIVLFSLTVKKLYETSRLHGNFENHTCKTHISESIDSDDNLAKKETEGNWVIYLHAVANKELLTKILDPRCPSCCPAWLASQL